MRQPLMLLFAAVLAAGSGSLVSAISSTPDAIARQIHPPETVQPSRSHKVSIVGEDNRRTYEAYAAEHNIPVGQLYRKYSATGRFYCGTGDLAVLGTAEVTIANNVIVTAAHALYDKDARPRSQRDDFSDCYFEPIKKPWETGRPTKYFVKETPTVGTKHARWENALDDWAVVRLKKAVDDVLPYQLDPRALKIGLRGINVAGGHVDMRDDRGQPIATIGDCNIRAIWTSSYGQGRTQVVTDCSVAGWASGSGFFAEANGQIAILAVLTKDKEGSYNGQPFNERGNRTTFRAISGEFLNALQRSAGKKPESDVPSIKKEDVPSIKIDLAPTQLCAAFPARCGPHDQRPGG